MKTLPDPKAGEIWDVALGPGRSPEQTGTRPMLVISAEWFNEAENYLVVAVPITGTHRQIPYQIDLDRREGGLSKHSVVMCDQVRSISVLRLARKRGEVNPDTLSQVRRMVGRITGVYGPE